MTKAGLDLIKAFEGFSPTVYTCPAGYPTIGYGHVVGADERDGFLHGIDQAIGEELLRLDVEVAERAVLRLITVPLDDGQYDALCSFTFNLGSGRLQRSTLRRKVNREEHADAAEEFLKWNKAGGRPLPGLTRRRQAEATLYALE